MIDKALEIIQGQVDTAKEEMAMYRNALAVRKTTITRSIKTVRSCKNFIKHCQRTGQSSHDAHQFYILAQQELADHESRREMLKSLISDRHETIYALSAAVERLRSN